MLHSAQRRYGEKLRASDGEISHVRDFYFDDKNWTVRYLVADTGRWLTAYLLRLRSSHCSFVEKIVSKLPRNRAHA